MIPKAAIESYLREPRDDHAWMKDLRREDIDDALAGLRPPADPHPIMRFHQRVGMLLGVAYPQFSMWYHMGTGKTLMSLELLRYWWLAGRIRRAIVFVTSDKAFLTWERQIKQYEIGIPHVSLMGPSTRKWEQLEQFENGIILLPYPGAVAMVSDLAPARGGKRKRRLNEKLLRRLAKGVDAIVFDESTKIGHHTSQTHKMARFLRRTVPVCYGLAGRPFGRDPTLLWGQLRVVDGGATLGKTLGLFRSAFFDESDNPWDESGRAKDYAFRKRKMPVLSRMARHRSLTYTSEECLDLPATSSVIEEVSFGEEAAGYYKRFVERVIAARGNLREMKNVFVRMRQISSGFVGLIDDETGERAEVEFDVNPKLDRLLELIEEVPDGHKAVVWYEFTHSGRRIVHELKELGVKSIWLWSGTKDPTAAQNRFFDDPETTVAVVNHRVGAYSLDGMQEVANYAMVYESPVSAIDREQMERRLIREGQKRKVFTYDLVMRGSVDTKILDYHKEGNDLMKALLKDPNAVLR